MTFSATMRLVGLLVLVGMVVHSLAHAGETEEEVAAHIEALDTGTRRDKFAALTALGEIGVAAHEATPAVLAVLESDSDYVSSRAFHTLRSIGATAEEVAPVLLRCLPSLDRDLRFLVVRRIAEFKCDSTAIADVLVNALGDEDEAVRLIAKCELIDRDLDDTHVADALLRCMEVSQGRTREDAGEALYLRHVPQQFLPRVLELLKDEEPDVRELAALSLRGLRGDREKAATYLAERLADGSSGVRAAAVLVLTLWDCRQPEVRRAALAIAFEKPSDPEVRERVISALARLPDDDEGRRRQALVAALRDDDSAVRAAGAGGLRRPHELPESAVAELAAALVDVTEEVRIMAAWALATNGRHTAAAVRTLTDATRSKNTWFVVEALSALQAIGPGAHAAVPRLRELQSDKCEVVSQCAGEALKAIQATGD